MATNHMPLGDVEEPAVVKHPESGMSELCVVSDDINSTTRE